VQYTNPLRAKVLLFSVLYQSWDKNNQDWTMLRSYTLDDLLKELMQNYQAIEDIETKLFGAARVLNDFESNLQTASTIVEAIKPYMTNN
jgi:chemotaxis receptor (MCP) glutamine deamidase CheD